MTVAIRATDLVKSYIPGVRALDGVSLDVTCGEVLVVMGPSGSGKSTLIRTFNGLEPLDGGELDVLGMRLDAAHEEHQVRAIRKRVGMVFQQFNLFPTSPFSTTSPWRQSRFRSVPRLRQNSGPSSSSIRWESANKRANFRLNSVVASSNGWRLLVHWLLIRR